MELRGDRAGPLLWLTAAVHGDEVAGLEVVHRLYEELLHERFRGRVRSIPGVNVAGVSAIRRTVPAADEDMNRLFPGDPAGSLAARIAHAVFRTIAADRPALAIDLHTDSALSIPYVILDRALSRAARPALAAAGTIAATTGLAVIHDWPLPEYRELRLDRSLSGALINHAAIPSFTLELGPTRVADPAFVEAGCHAVRAAMRELGMIERAAAAGRAGRGAPAPDGERRCRIPGVTAATGGLLRYRVVPGSEVREGAILATVVDLVGRVLEEIRAPAPGLIISLAERIPCYPGMTVATLAVLERRRRPGGTGRSRTPFPAAVEARAADRGPEARARRWAVDSSASGTGRCA
jgi:predicted deacylase